MAGWWSDIAGWMPWWAWWVGSLMALIGFTLAWASALAVLSAAGTHHANLTRRQQRMARYWSLASLAAIPLTALLGLFTLLAGAWSLLG